MSEIESNKRVASIICLLSLASCVSLLVFGLASLVLSLVFFEISGILIGGALVFHGYYEFRQREGFIRNRSMSFAKKLAWNQLGLALSVSAYLLWRYLSIGEDKLLAILDSDAAQTVLQQWPPEMIAELKATLPQLVGISYSIAAIVVIFGCVGMAALYRREGERLARLEA